VKSLTHPDSSAFKNVRARPGESAILLCTREGSKKIKEEKKKNSSLPFTRLAVEEFFLRIDALGGNSTSWKKRKYEILGLLPNGVVWPGGWKGREGTKKERMMVVSCPAR